MFKWKVIHIPDVGYVVRQKILFETRYAGKDGFAWCNCKEFMLRHCVHEHKHEAERLATIMNV